MVVEERAIPEPQRRKDNKPNLHKAVCSVRSSVCLYIILSVYSFCLSVCLSGYIQPHPINHLKYLKLACCGVNYENHLITQKFMRFIRIDT